MTSMTLRRGAPALALAAALALAGCGGGSTTTTTAGATAAASTTAPTVAPAPAGQSNDPAAAMAAAMKAAKSLHMSMKLATATGPGMAIEADMAYNSSGGTDLHMTTDLGGLAIESITVGGFDYVKMGSKWTKSPSKVQGNNAEQMVDSLHEGTLVKVGTDGDQTKYQLTGATSLAGEMFVWVGSDNLPSRMSVKASTGTVEVTYSNWGAAMNITAPPANQVVSG